jgi:hypothetical protein
MRGTENRITFFRAARGTGRRGQKGPANALTGARSLVADSFLAQGLGEQRLARQRFAYCGGFEGFLESRKLCAAIWLDPQPEYRAHPGAYTISCKCRGKP